MTQNKIMSNEILKRSILRTLVYYDALDYPLTAFEIWKHLIVSENCKTLNNAENKKNNYWNLMAVMVELEKEKAENRIEEFRGFYFLSGRKKLVYERRRREKISLAKIRHFRFWARWLRFSPFLRAILVTGRLAFKNGEITSDWDALIILKQGKIYTGRFFLTVWTHLLGKRRHNEKIKDRICLNCFLDADFLEIKEQNWFAAHEYSFAFPIFDSDEFFSRFQVANKWIKKAKPHWEKEKENLFILKDNFFSRVTRWLGEWIFASDFWERKLGAWQRKKIFRNPKTFQAGAFIRAEKERLIFWPEPQAPRICRRFEEKWRLLIKE